MIRVLFLSESFYPVLGGGEQHLLRLGRRLVEAGDQATVLTRQSETSWPREERLSGIRVLRVPPAGPGRTGKYRMLPAAFVRTRAELRAHDLLVVRGTRVLGPPGLLASRAARRPVVMQPEVNGELSGEVFTWGTALDASPAGRLVRAGARLRNRVLLDAEAFVAMSKGIADEFRGAGVPEERIAHIPHGVDCQRFRPAQPGERSALRFRLGLPADAIVACYTGRLLRGKGLLALVDAVARALAEQPSLHLVLAGSGAGQALSIEDELRRKVADIGLAARVSFTGQVENVDLWLRASDVFAFPSEFEGLGLSLVEAAATGLPCIGARTGGIVDVIEDGVSGLLFGVGDVSELAGALMRLAADPALRRAMGESARARVLKHFEEQDMLARYRALFLGVQRASRASR